MYADELDVGLGASPLNELENVPLSSDKTKCRQATRVVLNFGASPVPQAVCGAFYGGFSWETRVWREVCPHAEIEIIKVR